jgi:hypothetical protein
MPSSVSVTTTHTSAADATFGARCPTISSWLYTSPSKRNSDHRNRQDEWLQKFTAAARPFFGPVIDADLVYEKKNVPFEFVFHKEHDSWVLFGAKQR